MAREDQRGLRCRNSWRPSDGPLSPQAGDLQRQRSPVPRVRAARSSSTTRAPQPSLWRSARPRPHDQRLAETQAEGWRPSITPATTHTSPEPPPQTFKNPNLIPVVPRHSHTSNISSQAVEFQENEELEDERLPQIWHPSIDDLIRRTAYDYDLIVNYERDAEGGQRWLSEDIARIRDVGKNLHRDIFALRRWQRVIAEQGDQDKNMMMQIKRDANFLKLLCERVQRAINKYEQKCEFELLRNGVYAQDEDGNFYKPTAPQQYVAEGSCLQNGARPSIKDAEEDSISRPFDDAQSVYHPGQHHGRPASSSRRYRIPPKDPPGYPPKRNLAFDFAFRRTPFEKIKREAVRQQSEAARQSTFRRPDKVLDGRVSKSYREPPSAPKRRAPSPEYRSLSPESDMVSERPTSHKKAGGRGRNNIHQRDGVSRRQAKRDRAQERRPSQTAGRLGKHVLHY